MPSIKTTIAAAITGCLIIANVQASADETGVAFGAVFHIPFSGGLTAKEKKQPHLELGLSMRQESLAGFKRFDRRSMRLNLASVPFRGNRVDLRHAQMMGHGLFDTRTVFNADEPSGEASTARPNTLLYGILGLAVVGGVALAATSGGSDKADACIAIFPPPPGCP